MSDKKRCRHDKLIIKGEHLIQCEKCNKIWLKEKNKYVWHIRAGGTIE